MKRITPYILLICLSPLLWSCEEVIELDLNETQDILTIEGLVEPGQASVKLTRSVGFYEENTFESETGATVRISDSEGNTFDLLDADGDGVYEPESWEGTPGLTYNLTVETGGETYTSRSTMPTTVVSIDEIEVQDAPPGPGATDDPFSLFAYYQEPGDTQNFYQFIITKNGEKLPDLFLVNDDLNNGIRAGVPIFTVGFSSGDTAEISLYGIDEDVFRYLNGLAVIATPNPFGNAVPADPESNISGGALGYFSARTRHTSTLVIP
ncbi:MAG: DUF4249 domain-containing protein [Bacteroidota bacterium]